MGARPAAGDGPTLEAPDGLRPASIYLEEASVTGTETALLAAAAAPGVTELRHAACEPHVVEVCRFLEALGVRVEGVGSSTVRVHGGARLGGATHRLHGDYLEAGSWAVVAAVTRGAVEVAGARAEDLEPLTAVLRRMQVHCRVVDDVLHVEPSAPAGIGRIATGLWPGFPSDFVSLIAVLGTQAAGRTLIHDWMYELRLFALEQLSGMGADFFLCDPHRVIVTGPTRLKGRTLDGRDLRSGMALIAAALAADGESAVRPLETVERGYARVVENLASLGARVARVE
jgi:UDP-N-acetylglucosamine 1-carboxyvinyltransferase